MHNSSTTQEGLQLLLLLSQFTEKQTGWECLSGWCMDTVLKCKIGAGMQVYLSLGCQSPSQSEVKVSLLASSMSILQMDKERPREMQISS